MLATPELATEITIEAGKRLLTISKDRFAAVYVNGRDMGHVDECSNPMQERQLNPGEYAVKLVPVDASDGKEEKARIEAGKVAVVLFK